MPVFTFSVREAVIFELETGKSMIQFLILPVILTSVLSSSINSKLVCPDGSSCLDSATCCPINNNGSFGCCILKNAVCCSELGFCCPGGSRCLLGFCVPPESNNLTLKTAIERPSEIHCFDTEYVCPDNSTCCEGLEASTYACCPLKNAVCCKDHQHCCPENMRCDLESQKCLGKGHVSLMYNFNKTRDQTSSFRKLEVITKPSNGSNIVCPGSEFQCPDSYTCCQLSSGDWGCCPFTNAACCPDHEHCCPAGMKCDASSQSCQKKGLSIKSVLKVPSKPLSMSNVCPDKSSCLDLSTCCKISLTKYGCCPYPNATCCSDGVHCCPNGFMCDTLAKQCVPEKEHPVKENYLINMI